MDRNLWVRTPDRRAARPPVVKLPDSDLPAALLKDLDAAAQQLETPDPFADEVRQRPLRAATVKQETRMLKRFASELILAGVPAEEITSIRALCEPVRAEIGLRQMVARKENKTHSVTSDMGRLLCTWARRLEIDSTSFQRLEKLAKRVALPPQRGMTQKNRSRLRVLQDHTTLRRLLELPERLFKRANKLEPKKAGLMREDAIAIALLLVCPLRIKNLAGLHIEQHFQRPGDGRLFVSLWKDEVKNGTAIDFEVPADVRRMLDKYLASRTPQMCPEGTPWLFPRRDGSSSVDTSTFSTRLSLRIRKEIGVEMNAHLFRHLAAMIWLNANPGAYEGARRLLGHSSVSTTINVYSGLETRAAIQAYGEVLANHRSTKK
jgi:integrase